jgi:undecaprenyl diphosphate synthase
LGEKLSTESFPPNSVDHIAFIMDGNGRWAAKRGLPRTTGHKKGGEAFRAVARGCKNAGIKYCTFFAFSTENINRPKEEVDTLFDLFRDYLDEAEGYAADKTRLVFLGDRTALPDDISAKMTELERKSRDFNEMTLSLAVNYGGQDDIVNAAVKLGRLCRDRDIRPDDIDKAMFSSMLYTKDLPPVDFLVRTGGERRISNFLLFQSAYAEIYFSKLYWPDWNEAVLKEALKDYENRDRRFGNIK